jgi:hypothetical protein
MILQGHFADELVSPRRIEQEAFHSFCALWGTKDSVRTAVTVTGPAVLSSGGESEQRCPAMSSKNINKELTDWGRRIHSRPDQILGITDRVNAPTTQGYQPPHTRTSANLKLSWKETRGKIAT